MGTLKRHWACSRILIAAMAAASSAATSGCTAKSGGDASQPNGASLSVSALSAAGGGKVAIGGNTACALYVDGVYCWGDNTRGQVNGTSSPASVLTRAKVDFGTDTPIDLAVGGTFACAIVNPGQKIRCWGSNDSLQLGYSTPGSGPYPPVAGAYVVTRSVIPIAPLSGIRQITLGSKHGCALDMSGTVSCWGDNSSYQLGTGSNSPWTSLAQTVIGPFPATTIAAGNYFTCAMDQTAGGGLYCWGIWAAGIGIIPPLTKPVAIGGFVSLGSCSPILLPSTLGLSHVCATVSKFGPPVFGCGGFDYEGEYGSPTTPAADLPNMNMVASISAARITALALASQRTCAIMSGGVQCWGVLSGTCTTQACYNTSPQPVSTLGNNVTALAVGPSSACAIQGGALFCWGLNASGQLGNGTVTDSPVTPVQVQ